MPTRKLSLHIGADSFLPAAFPADRQPTFIPAPADDARAMHRLAVDAGLAATLLIGSAATRDNVTGAIECASSRLAADDLLVITYSGHGGLHRDAAIVDAAARPLGATNRYANDEPGGYDQSWYLYDGVLIDDIFHDLLVKFVPGVRIHVLSDSCNAGDILRDDETAKTSQGSQEVLRGDPEPDRSGTRRPIKASALLSAASSPTSATSTNGRRGAFTVAIEAVWNGGTFAGDVVAFHQALQEHLRGDLDVPDLKRYGATSLAFERSRPFGAEGTAEPRRPQHQRTTSR